MVLFDAVADFVGFLQVALIVLAIKEAIGVFRGEGGQGGLGGFKIPEIFGGGGNNNARSAERAEAGEDARERKEAEGAAGAAGAEGKEENIVERLSAQEIKDLQAIRNFVDRIRNYAASGQLTHEQVKAIAKAKAGALEAAVKRLLDYSNRAKQANNAAEGAMKKIERQLKNAWMRRMRTEAAEAKAQAPKGQQNATYNKMVKPMEQKINQRVQQLMLDARQGERTEESVKQAIEQVRRMEESIMGEVKALVQEMESGRVQQIPAIVGRMDSTITQTQRALASVERLTESVKAAAADLRRRFLQQETDLTKEGQTELNLMRQQGVQLAFKMQ